MFKNGRWTSSHHVKLEGEKWRSKLLPFHWPELSALTTLSFKRGWERCRVFVLFYF